MPITVVNNVQKGTVNYNVTAVHANGSGTLFASGVLQPSGDPGSSVDVDELQEPVNYRVQFFPLGSPVAPSTNSGYVIVSGVEETMFASLGARVVDTVESGITVKNGVMDGTVEYVVTGFHPNGSGTTLTSGVLGPAGGGNDTSEVPVSGFVTYQIGFWPAGRAVAPADHALAFSPVVTDSVVVAFGGQRPG